MQIDLNFYVHKHQQELRAVADLVTDEHDEQIAKMSLHQLVEAVAIANAMIWELMYFVDDNGEVRKRRLK